MAENGMDDAARVRTPTPQRRKFARRDRTPRCTMKERALRKAELKGDLADERRLRRRRLPRALPRSALVGAPLLEEADVHLLVLLRLPPQLLRERRVVRRRRRQPDQRREPAARRRALQPPLELRHAPREPQVVEREVVGEVAL